ncbi:amidohydrolase family protein [Aliifodinibius sp. S!AR15-10]|uniref:amidohydrolase family protein n=1 Tax=Aliifodinibius sp. S!AR15-10 TaxID=2950437 RepID=UPI002863CAE3|nr:amidohydrolase family protein [Aliifodinibius sp. S!AR15-10]MDR8391529.1 amidohydrolase family protein [Aliifodinibius sp. S!AR15-10]
MKMKILFLLTAGLLLSCTSEEPVEADKIIENVNVISMANDGEIQENRTVVIRGDRIVRITGADRVQMPDTAERIDGGGGYLIPGLSEMHAHIPSDQDNMGYIEDVLFLYLSNGITTIRGMLGQPIHLKLREQAAQNEIVSPRIYTSGPGFSGGSIESPEQARQRVRDQHKLGYDFLKIFPGLSLEEYNAIADEANSVGIEFSGHIPASVGLQRALEAGQGTIDHLDKYMEALVADTVDVTQVEDPGVIYFGMHLVPYVDSTKITEVAQMTAESSTWNVPTQALLEHVIGTDSAEVLAQRPEFKYLPSDMVKEWINSKQSITGNEIYTEELAQQYLQIRRDMIKALHDQGAGLLLGSDAPQIFNVPGFSVHHELQYIVDAGLTSFEALRTGTYNPAEYFDNLENTGTIEEGKIADMVLLENNPLDDISNSTSVAGVIYRGNWLSKAEIDKRLAEIAAKHE